MLSGAVTYFGLLSFFPILALVFAVSGSWWATTRAPSNRSWTACRASCRAVRPARHRTARQGRARGLDHRCRRLPLLRSRAGCRRCAVRCRPCSRCRRLAAATSWSARSTDLMVLCAARGGAAGLGRLVEPGDDPDRGAARRARARRRAGHDAARPRGGHRDRRRWPARCCSS